MRPKVALSVLGACALFALALLVLRAGLLSRSQATRSPAPLAQETEAKSGAAAESPPASTPRSAAVTASTAPAAAAKTNSAEDEAALRSRVATLARLGLMDDPASLQVILGELTNSTRAIRQAALDAAVQFGSREAIPKLKEAADATADPREKVAFLDAADYLELPSWTEIRARSKQKKNLQLTPRSAATNP